MARARDILLRLTGDPSDAKRALGDVSGELRDFDRIKAEARAEIKTAGAKAELERLERRLAGFSRQEATPAIKLKAAKTLEQIERVEKKLRELDGSTATVTVKEKDGAGEGGKGGGGGVLALAGGKAGVAAGAVGLGAAVGIKQSAEASIEAEKSAARLKQQLETLGISYDDNKAKIDKVISAQSQLSGLDDEDLADSFTNLVRVTGDVNKALEANALAADLARAKNIPVAKAGEIVSKALAGNVGALRKYGVEVEKGASSTEILGAIQKKFGGQAEAYGKTTAGALDRAGTASENLKEALGDALRPAITAVANTFADFIRDLPGYVAKGKKAIKDFVDDNRRTFRTLAGIIDNVIDLFREIGPRIARALRSVARIVKGAIKIIAGILTGDFGKAWDGVKDVFQGGIDLVKGALDDGYDLIRGAGRRLGNGLKAGISAGIKGIASIAIGIINGVISAVNKGIDLINEATPGAIKVPGVGTIVPEIPDIPNIGKITVPGTRPRGGTTRPTITKPAFGGAGRAASIRSGNTFQIMTPSGGPPDPRVLAGQLEREVARRG